MASYKLLLLPGDGIGPEVAGGMQVVLDTLKETGLATFETETDLVGGCAIDAHGVPLADATLQRAKDADAILLGAVGGPKWAGVAYENRSYDRNPGGKDSVNAVGWTVGGGVDVAVTDNVFVRGEYRYTDYGKDTFKLTNANYKSSATEHRLMAGVGVKFNSPF